MAKLARAWTVVALVGAVFTAPTVSGQSASKDTLLPAETMRKIIQRSGSVRDFGQALVDEVLKAAANRAEQEDPAWPIAVRVPLEVTSISEPDLPDVCWETCSSIRCYTDCLAEGEIPDSPDPERPACIEVEDECWKEPTCVLWLDPPSAASQLNWVARRARTLGEFGQEIVRQAQLAAVDQAGPTIGKPVEVVLPFTVAQRAESGGGCFEVCGASRCYLACLGELPSCLEWQMVRTCTTRLVCRHRSQLW